MRTAGKRRLNSCSRAGQQGQARGRGATHLGEEVHGEGVARAVVQPRQRALLREPLDANEVRVRGIERLALVAGAHDRAHLRPGVQDGFGAREEEVWHEEVRENLHVEDRRDARGGQRPNVHTRAACRGVSARASVENRRD